MPANRFYLDADLSSKETLLLEGNEYHHLAHVMRQKTGDIIELVDGKGTIAQGRIKALDKKNGSIEVLSFRKEDLPSNLFSLGIPLMRPSKLEWIVEKGTELGAHAFLFYLADHSEKDALSKNQLDRLHTIAISSLKQSGRLYLPSIEILSDLSSLLLKEAKVYFGDPGCEKIDAFQEFKSFPIIFVTGPEAGFTKDELDLLQNKGKGMCLSSYVLRAETAPIAAASLLGFLGNELSYRRCSLL